MKELYLTNREGIAREEVEQMMDDLLAQYDNLQKVLIIPPDFTRCYSYAGEITQILYTKLAPTATVHVMPALGTHMAMDDEEKQKFFNGVVPEEAFLVHHWQTDTISIGSVPKEVVSEISEGLYETDIEVEVNEKLINGGYDLILSVGQVVPHEVVGMANYSKNIFVGVGGRQMINKSHMLSAICGMEKALGVADSPARKVFDYAQEHFLNNLPLVYIQTVTTTDENDNLSLNGIYTGSSRKPFELAVELSSELNIVHVERRAKKVVTYLDPYELKTTWVGNKGVYRTRMTVADGGDLIILAPGVKAFGENEEMDKMTRTYGYKGRDYVLDLFNKGAFDNKIMSAAHLIQGSSDGRFTITYCTKPENLSKEEINQVGYEWMNYAEASKLYDPESLKDGWNTLPNGEEIYFVKTPALGLWKVDEG
ncbi:MAG: lactate racemase domain-containing protein [Lachnospiraceae bacterium]|nr:lactate racemase domain-containing protein [Lachnospiraceae bacterium]MDD3616769.1 lactate racemase domain-containing protein [Lachnospiraceae bacterium]